MQLPTGQVLDKLISSFCEEREEAIAGRQELEHIWQKARAQYKGKKEGSTSSSYEKGETLNSALVANTERPTRSKRSTVVPNITRPYTNAGTARVADLLLPTGKMPFSLRQTPVSDLQTVYGYLSDYPTVLQQLTTALPDIFSKIQDAESAKMAAENAELIIRDWLKESDWSAAVRAQIVRAGIVGTGVIKGPFSKERKVSEDTKQILNTLYSIDDPILAELLVQELKTYYTILLKLSVLRLKIAILILAAGQIFRTEDISMRKFQKFLSVNLWNTWKIPHTTAMLLKPRWRKGLVIRTSNHKKIPKSHILFGLGLGLLNGKEIRRRISRIQYHTPIE